MSKYKLGQKVFLVADKPPEYSRCVISGATADACIRLDNETFPVLRSLLGPGEAFEDVEIVGHQETVIPIRWLGWDLMDTLEIYYYQATFTEDFGVFKKGPVEGGLNVDYGKGILTQTDEHENVILQQRFKVVPV